jgi:hypothetical protein
VTGPVRARRSSISWASRTALKARRSRSTAMAFGESGGGTVPGRTKRGMLVTAAAATTREDGGRALVPRRRLLCHGRGYHARSVRAGRLQNTERLALRRARDSRRSEKRSVERRGISPRPVPAAALPAPPPGNDPPASRLVPHGHLSVGTDAIPVPCVGREGRRSTGRAASVPRSVPSGELR